MARGGSLQKIATALERPLDDRFDRDQFVDQPDAQRLPGRNEEPADAEALGLALADHPHQRGVDHPRQRQAHLDLVQADPEVALRHHPRVAEDRQHRAAGRGVAGDRRHGRNRRGGEGAHEAEEVAQRLLHAGAVEGEQRRHVEPAGEHPRPAGEHQGARSRGRRRLDRLAERRDQRRVERIRRRPRQPQFQNVAMFGSFEHRKASGTDPTRFARALFRHGAPVRSAALFRESARGPVWPASHRCSR